MYQKKEVFNPRMQTLTGKAVNQFKKNINSELNKYYQKQKLYEGEGKAKTFLKFFGLYMKPAFCNQVTWNSLQKVQWINVLD